MFTNFLNENAMIDADNFHGEIFHASGLNEDVSGKDLEIMMLEAEVDYAQNVQLMLIAEASINPVGATAKANGDYEALNEAVEALNEAEEGFWANVKKWIAKLWKSIVAFFSDILTKITNLWANRTKFVKDNIKRIKDGVLAYKLLAAEKQKSLDEKSVPKTRYKDDAISQFFRDFITALKTDMGHAIANSVSKDGKGKNAKIQLEEALKPYLATETSGNFTTKVADSISFFKKDMVKNIKEKMKETQEKLKTEISSVEKKLSKDDKKDELKKEIAELKAESSGEMTASNKRLAVINKQSGMYWSIINAAYSLGEYGKDKKIKESYGNALDRYSQYL